MLSDASKREAAAFFNLGHCKKVMLVIGGSQGAQTLNEFTLSLIKNCRDELADVGIIWCTGAGQYQKYREAIKESNDAGSVYMSPFVEDVGMAYLASDIAISRSGAGVMMELAAAGIPSVLIPYPFAASDHQNKNADVFAETGAALKIANADATAVKAAPLLFDLLLNESKLARMAECTRNAALVHAGDTIAEGILK